MKKALLLDTSIGTSNVGDHIIMECVEQELAPILANAFVFLHFIAMLSGETHLRFRTMHRVIIN